MRIIAGKYKGHHLLSFRADHIRPTMDRVKETLFNIWMGEVENSVCLDLFSGTGSLGLEALSRGAQHVTFVDSNRKSIEILKGNLEKLKIREGFTIVQKDFHRYLLEADQSFDLILIDPPFTEKLAHEVMEQMAQSQVVKPSSLIAIESERRERIEASYPPLVSYNSRDFGDKKLSLFRMSE